MIDDQDYSWIEKYDLEIIKRYFMNIIAFRGIIILNEDNIYPDIIITTEELKHINTEIDDRAHRDKYKKYKLTFNNAIKQN